MTNLAFISDIHGNAIALTAVLADIQKQDCQHIFVLGDIINGMEPSKCITLLKTIKNIVCIKGNAEHYVLTPDLETFPRRDEEIYRYLLSVLQWWKEHLSPADLEFINALPDSIHLDHWYLVHDSPMDRLAVKQNDLGGIDEKYRDILFHGAGIPENLPADELGQIVGFMDGKRLSGLFIGHTHIPYIKHINGKMICNLGSVGFTLDGDPRPSWILCQLNGNQQKFSIRRVHYDIQEAILQLKEIGFLEFAGDQQQNAYIKMLQTGIHWRMHI